MHLLTLFVLLTWVNECKVLINEQIVNRNDTYLNELVSAIPQGIYLANLISDQEKTPQENLDRCILTITIANRESTFNLLAKNKTCLGLYQIKPSTAKDILKDLFLIDESLKQRLFQPLASTIIFNLLIDKFFNKYKTLNRVLVRYNNSKRVSKEILDHYNQIRNRGFNVKNNI